MEDMKFWPFSRKQVVETPAPLSSQFVPMHYQMDPTTDDLLANGRLLRNGMVVLVEDSIIRQDVRRLDVEEVSPYDLERALEANRWATVTEIEFRYDDLVKFVAVYEDGSKKIRRYNVSYGWLVKLDSLVPSETEASV